MENNVSEGMDLYLNTTVVTYTLTASATKAQNQSQGGFFQKLGNWLGGNGWKTNADVVPPPDVQTNINEGTPPSADMISCPNCKYYPKDVQKAVNAHEKEHMKQMAAMGLAEAAACIAVTSCHRAMELDAYRAESVFVNKRLSELNAEQAQGPLGQQDQISLRVLTVMKTQEDTFFRYPTLLDDK